MAVTDFDTIYTKHEYNVRILQYNNNNTEYIKKNTIVIAQVHYHFTIIIFITQSNLIKTVLLKS